MTDHPCAHTLVPYVAGSRRCIDCDAVLPRGAPPSLESLYGSVPDLAGGLDSVEYVRRQRDAEAAPPRATTPPKWGDALRYLTDDRDYPASEQRELLILQGGNGDYYVQIVEPGQRVLRGVRICMSGGCSSANPALARAIADAYRALYDAAHGRESPTPPMRALSGSPSRDSGALLDAYHDAIVERDSFSRIGRYAEYEKLCADARAALDRHLASLERDAARMREALEFYAYADANENDFGKRARAALAAPTTTPETRE